MKANRTAPAEAPVSAQTRCENNPPQRILIMDDDSPIRQLSSEVLIRSGYEVDGVENDGAAWRALQSDSYDLLIADNNVPNLIGIELLKKLRAARMELPVIMVTGALPMMELRRYPWLQPAAALIKPYSPAELLGVVKMVLCATDSPRERINPLAGWQSQPSAAG
jgi:DNA-binding response OmpR family regulator